MRATALNDTILGVLSLILGLWVATVTARYPGMSAGFPYALAVYLVIPIGALLLLKGLLRFRFEARPVSKRDEDAAATQLVQFTPITIGVIAAVCVTTLAIGYLGFIAAVALLAVLTGLLFRMPLWATAVYVVAQSLLLWGFLRFFTVQMPAGVLL